MPEPQALALGDFERRRPARRRCRRPRAATTVRPSPCCATAATAILHAVEDIRAGNGPSAVAVADVDRRRARRPVGRAATAATVDHSAGAAGDGFGDADRGEHRRPQRSGLVAVDLNGDERPDIAVVDSQNNRVAGQRSHRAAVSSRAAQLYPVTDEPRRASTSRRFQRRRPARPRRRRAARTAPARRPQPGQRARRTRVHGRRLPGRARLRAAPAGQRHFARRADTESRRRRSASPRSIPTATASDDLLVANLASDTVSVLRSNGDGTFTHRADAAPRPRWGRVRSPRGGRLQPRRRRRLRRDQLGRPRSSSATSICFKGSCTRSVRRVQRHGGRSAPASWPARIVARDFTGDQIVDLARRQPDRPTRCSSCSGVGDGTMRASTSPDSVSRMPIAIAAGGFRRRRPLRRVSAPTAIRAPTTSRCSTNCVARRGLRSVPPGPAAGSAGAARRRQRRRRALGGATSSRSAARSWTATATQVEAIAHGGLRRTRASPGVDANGDGRVDRAGSPPPSRTASSAEPERWRRRSQLQRDLQDAMRARDRQRIDVLRGLIAAIKNPKVERQMPSCLRPISSRWSARSSTSASRSSATRSRPAAPKPSPRAEAEKAILEAYLPAQLDAAALER